MTVVVLVLSVEPESSPLEPPLPEPHAASVSAAAITTPVPAILRTTHPRRLVGLERYSRPVAAVVTTA
ncbi:hypothetical protein GCM10027055_26460 [Janibacter alkaliphilus]